MRKKRVLFVINNLSAGGAEKALVSLLHEWDYARYDVDLLLFSPTGLFLDQVPDAVRLLPAPKAFRFFDMPITQVLRHALTHFDFAPLWARLRMKNALRGSYPATVREQLTWPCIAPVIPALDEPYDAAIAYLQKTPIYYIVDKVEAPVKIGFIHNDYQHLQLRAGLDRPYFAQLQVLASISESCVHILKETFPDLASRIHLKYNMISKSMIQRLASAPITEDFDGLTVVSIGRLQSQKAFDQAIDSCALLVAKGYRFRWYIIGEGPDRPMLEEKIKAQGLEQVFILLGLRANPYPYLQKATVYAQPSRYEGKSIAIDEAKVLGKPIVVTNYPSARDQITHGVNGLIADMSAEAVAATLAQLLDDAALRSQLTENLRQEAAVGKEELTKLYHWIENATL